MNNSVKIAQEQLGHASISTTLNIYTHVVDASHRKAIEARLAILLAGLVFWYPTLVGFL